MTKNIIVAWIIFPFLHFLFYSLFGENFVIVICTEDEVEWYLESFAINNF